MKGSVVGFLAVSLIASAGCRTGDAASGERWKDADFRSASSRRWMELSDVVTFHGYDSVGGLAEKIRLCNEYGRPVLCTECMIRRNGNTLAGFLPLFAEQHVGWFQWWLVAGCTHTFHRWIEEGHAGARHVAARLVSRGRHAL